jgi:nitrate reductase cytochrome c-type subunit (napB)
MKTYKLIFMTTCLVALLSGCNTDSSKNENLDVSGLRTGDVIEENITLEDINWTKPMPGESTRYDRSYENAPPLIPHDITDIVPITKDNNMCISCHMPEVAESVGSTPIPKSHLYSIRFKKDKGGELSQDRFNCTQCHVPQANVKPRVKNNFAPDYTRQQNSQHRSNLLDVLNDGVK